MTTYDTTALAQAIIGEDAVEANRKAATRTLRKFLRADFAEKELRTPGKGGRYSIDLNKRELTAMTKRFKAWQEQQEAEKAARAEALKVAKAPKAEEAPEEPEAPETDEELEDDNELEGPTDEEIAAMLADDDES